MKARIIINGVIVEVDGSKQDVIDMINKYTSIPKPDYENSKIKYETSGTPTEFQMRF